MLKLFCKLGWHVKKEIIEETDENCVLDYDIYGSEVEYHDILQKYVCKTCGVVKTRTRLEIWTGAK